MAIYIVMNVGTFAVIVAMRRKGRAVEEIDDLAGLGRTDPAMALWMAVFMFSMAGIPPLAGFFGKLYVFLAAVQGGFWVLAMIGVLTSVVSAYYYLRIVKVMYFDQRAAGALDRAPASLSVVMAGSGPVQPVLHPVAHADAGRGRGGGGGAARLMAESAAAAGWRLEVHRRTRQHVAAA